MIIGVDGNEANVENRVGSNVYAFEVIKGLAGLATNETEVKLRVYLKKDPLKSMPGSSTILSYQVFGPGPLWTQWRLPLQLSAEKLSGNSPQIFFTPGHYAPRWSPVPVVISIMDLAYEKYPQEFRPKDLEMLRRWTKYSVRKAAHIFTISQASKNDLVDLYGVDPQKITVTYPGVTVSPSKHEEDDSFQSMKLKLGLATDYLVYVGTLQPRKNLVRLIEAYKVIKQKTEYTDLQLIVVGKKGWMYEEIFGKVRQLGLEKDIIFTGYISDWEKNRLIEHAKALVLPSLYEGFGIPVVEAMKLGVPAVVSRVSSLPEVGGEAVVYIQDPRLVADIGKSLIEVLQLSQNQRLALIARAKKQAEKFSWAQCVETTYATLQSLVEQEKV